MKFKMFSVVLGTSACIAKCPFCVSREDYQTCNIKSPEVHWRNFDIACNLANRSQVDTVMLTSRGEPLLYPEQISDYLRQLKPYKFPFIELQTNGILIDRKYKKLENHLRDWYENGLTTFCLSVVSYDETINKKIYTPDSQYMNLNRVIDKLHKIGFSVRLTCILGHSLTSTIDEIKKMIEFCKKNNVEQLTLRPLNNEYRRKEVAEWIEKHKLSDLEKGNIRLYLEKEGTELLRIDRIGSIYDVMGQNVMFSVPLDKKERDINPENGRQLIFFPNGRIYYEWEMEGGILL